MIMQYSSEKDYTISHTCISRNKQIQSYPVFSSILFCCSPSLFGNYLVTAYYTIKWYDLFVYYFDSRVPHQGYKNEWTAQPLSDFVFYLVDEEMDLVKHRNRQEYGSTLGEKRWRLRWKMSFKGQG